MPNDLNIIIEEVTEFLGAIPPFSFLDIAALRNIACGVSMEFHPKGRTIVQQGGPSASHLSIIKKGGVKVFIKAGEEDVLVDYLSEGDSFGLLSLLCGDMPENNAVAAEDTICYLIDKETILDLVKTHAVVSEFYLKALAKKFTNIVYQEMQGRSLLYGGGDKLLFTIPLNELASKDVVTAPQDVSIKEAAGKMSLNKISSLVLVDSDGFPAGIVTDKDLRDKVVSKGRNINDAVSDIMSVTLLKSEARDYCFEALLKMIRYNIHHLLVVNRGEIKGIITSHDLMMMQGASPLAIAKEIESQKTVEGLIPAAKKINSLITLMIKESARAGNITRIITEINDRLLRKILEIAEKKFGKPPVPYCWIVFGSEGRKEQTFKTDQDNAIIYEDPPSDEDEEDIRSYFSEFSLFVKDALVKCGFPLCPADYMASNPMWRQPLKVWKEYFSNWINTPTPEAILFSLIFFDFRPVHGNFTLAERLRAYLFHALKNQNTFLMHMAGELLRHRPPFSLFGRFVVEKNGDHKGRIDIKKNGISFIVDLARLSALEKGVYHTSTIERFKELKNTRSIVAEYGEELEQAFEFLMGLRLLRQFENIQAGIEPDNFIDPGRLSGLDRKMLEESFRLITKMQESAKKQYHKWMSMT